MAGNERYRRGCFNGDRVNPAGHSMVKSFKQHYRKSSCRFWRTVLTVLVGIAGFASNTHAQTIYQVLTSLDGPTSGENPDGGLIEGTDGSFYGTTTQGGAWGFGTVFKIDATGIVTTLHSFNSTDGASPARRADPGKRRELLRHDTLWRRGGLRHRLQARRDGDVDDAP